MLQLCPRSTPPPRRPPLPGVLFRFDRRRSDRRRAEGRVTAVRRDHSVRAHRHRVCGLELRDISEEGMGAISDAPLSVDEQISIIFSPHGNESGFELRGHVVRCRPTHGSIAGRRIDAGYEVGIRFDPESAA